MLKRTLLLMTLFVVLLLPFHCLAAEEPVLLDVPAYNQRALGYPTGCEITAVGMMLDYAVGVDLLLLADEMPYAVDPNEGFRGNPRTEAGFTIFPLALVPLVHSYIGNAYDMSGLGTSDIIAQLDLGAPVACWINGLGWNVHCITLTGYNAEGFYYNDPWTGSKNSFIAYEHFERIWDNPIYDSFYGVYYPSRKALSYIVEFVLDEAESEPEPNIMALVIGGRRQEFSALRMQDVIYVPVWETGTALGALVTWESPERSARLFFQEAHKVLTLFDELDYCVVNEMKIDMGAAAFYWEGDLYAPIRAFYPDGGYTVFEATVRLDF